LRERTTARWFWNAVVTLTLVATAFGVSQLVDSTPQNTPARITVVYVGADDCAPCKVWQRVHWPQFSSSPEFVRLTYRELTSPKLFDLLSDERWPESLRDLRGEFDRTPGAPMWFVLNGEELLVTARGLRQWEEEALPRIRLLARQS
jgi:hypothetical protein